jgi:hypothetical protein
MYTDLNESEAHIVTVSVWNCLSIIIILFVFVYTFIRSTSKYAKVEGIVTATLSNIKCSTSRHCNALKCVRFQVLAAASMNMITFWVITLCSLVEVDSRFRDAYCLWNVSLLHWDYTVLYPIRLSSSPWNTVIKLSHHLNLGHSWQFWIFTNESMNIRKLQNAV